jgi:hypothetical protein
MKNEKQKNLVVIRLCFQDKKKKRKNEAKISMQIIFVFLSNFFGKFDVVGFVMKIDCSYYYYYY